LEKPLCSFCIPTGLHKKNKGLAICVNRPPLPMLLATDRDHDFVHVPFIVNPGTIPSDAIFKMSAKSIDLEPNRFPTNNHIALG
jgi:hypothetical protein